MINFVCIRVTIVGHPKKQRTYQWNYLANHRIATSNIEIQNVFKKKHVYILEFIRKYYIMERKTYKFSTLKKYLFNLNILCRRYEKTVVNIFNKHLNLYFSTA